MPCREVRVHTKGTSWFHSQRTDGAGRKRARDSWGVLFCAAFVLLLGVPPGIAAESLPSSEDCLACHSDSELSKTGPGGRQLSLFVDQTLFQGSVHGFLECVQCHTDATEVPHPETLKRVQCQTCHEVGVPGAHALLGRKEPACSTCHGSHAIRPPSEVQTTICSQCHASVVEVYDKSVHGMALSRGDGEVASCHNCHGSAHDLKEVRDPGSPVYPLNLPRTCGTCHGDPDLAKRHGIGVANAYQLYMDSIHGRALARSGLLVAANCSSCHGFHEIRPKDDPASKVHRMNVPSTCGACHAGVLTEYSESVHGSAVRNGKLAAPVCIDCHSAHQIARVETVAWRLEIISECGTCHGESLRTYRDTFHGQVTGLGFARVARCSDCHGSHRIFPVSDARSSVAPPNRVATCQQCHPKANDNFAQYSPHADPKDKERNPGLYYVARFMNALMIGVFAFFGLHTSLWLSRSMIELGKARKRPPEEPREKLHHDEKEGGDGSGSP